MKRLSVLALFGGVLVLSGGTLAQDAKKVEVKKADPAVKVKGMLPMNWGKIGLSNDQRQEIYKIQNKYNAEIDKLEAKILEAKSARDQEMKAILSADQKKKLEDILIKKGAR